MLSSGYVLGMEVKYLNAKLNILVWSSGGRCGLAYINFGIIST